LSIGKAVFENMRISEYTKKNNNEHENEDLGILIIKW
jgi:hypothetical protein